jgi:peptidoglycan hydrolase CwlO-like protein
MKKNLVILMAVALFAVASPVLADEMQMDGMKMDETTMQHGASHGAMDEKCAKECAMLLKNCKQEVNSIQANIKKLQVEIKEKGANTYTVEELKTLNKKLKEANATLRDLQKPGK